MKVLAVCSLGGHLTELQALMPAFEGHQVVWVTYQGERTKASGAYLLENFGRKPWRYLAGLGSAWRILRLERPVLVISTGSEIALPFFLVARAMGIHTLFVESLTRIHAPSGTGRLLFRVAKDFYVQWPQLRSVLGGGARYEGGLL